VKTTRILISDNSKTYSVWEYLLGLSALILIMLVCFILFGIDTNPLLGFISSSIIFLIITIAATWLLLRDKKWISFFITAYLVKLVIGLVHYLVFIDPTYFSTLGQNSMLHDEFTYTFYDFINTIKLKQKYGMFMYNNQFNVTHEEIWNIISIPFVNSGAYILNLTPLNSFMSLLASINIILISNYRLQYDAKKLKAIAIITAYFPSMLITSYFSRDTTGAAFISIGITLIMFSPRGIIRFIMVPLAAYLFYMQRTVYPLILVVSFFIDYLISNKKISSLLYRFILLIVAIPSFYLFMQISLFLGFAEGENTTYIESAGRVNYMYLPVKILMGIVGPFPWTQYFTSGRIDYSYQFAEYLQGAFNVAMVFLMITYHRFFYKKEQFNLLNLIGLLLILSGLATTNMHSSYVSIGVLFLIPWIVNSVPLTKLKKYYRVSFIWLLFFSLMVSTLFGGLGLKNLWM
jgi:hypothetical protein